MVCEDCTKQKLLWKPAKETTAEELLVDGLHDEDGRFVRLQVPCRIPVAEIPTTNGVYDVDYIMWRVAEHARDHPN